MIEQVFPIFGPPLQILTDRGSDFESGHLDSLYEWYNVDKLRTTPYKPSTNETVERIHRTPNSILAKIIREDQRDWCERVPVAAAA